MLTPPMLRLPAQPESRPTSLAGRSAETEVFALLTRRVLLGRVKCMNCRRESSRIARQLTTVRQKKIDKIKTKILAGKYRIDNLEIAKALFLAR